MKNGRQKIAQRALRGALCLITALARHGLTDMIPPRIDIALPRGSRVPTLRKSIDVHVFAREAFDLRREVLAVGEASRRHLLGGANTHRHYPAV